MSRQIFPTNKNILSKKVVDHLGSGWWARQPSETWWSRIEEQEEPTAQIGDTFLVRRDINEHEVSLGDGTERVLRPGAKIWNNHPFVEGTYKVIRVVTEYGSTRIDDEMKWCRYTVSYVEGEETPYPFKYDRYAEHEEMVERMHQDIIRMYGKKE